MVLDESVHQKVTELAEAGDQAAEVENYDHALEKYQQALALLPRPWYDWDAALWLLAAIGDATYSHVQK